MKKFLTLLAAVLMSISMMAKDVSFACTDTWSQNGKTLTNTKEGVTVTITWTNDVQYSKLTYFTFATVMSTGSVTVSVSAPDETITNLKIEDAGVLYNGTDISHTFELAKLSSMNIGEITVTLEDAPAPLVATPSVTEFSTLDDLNGMTITFTGNVPQYAESVDDMLVVLTDPDITDPVWYALATDITCNPGEINIEEFFTMEDLTTLLPTSECDMVLVLSGIFKDQEGYVIVPIHYIPEAEVANLQINLNDAGYATFSCKRNVNVSGVEAYKAAVEGETITLTKLEGYIPAGTGVLFYSENPEAEVSLSLATSGVAANVTGNALKATIKADGTLAAKEANSWALGTGNQFLSYTGAAYIHNRAYLVHEKAAGARSMSIVFADGEVTRIDDIVNELSACEGKLLEGGKIVIVKDGKKYNLAGQEIK